MAIIQSTHSSALDLITRTPLVCLRRIYDGPGRLYAKLEFMQPGGSVKDRAALWILKEAYRTGNLAKGQPVVEMTSGNMGAGLAVVCANSGNPLTVVMSSGNSPERAKMLEALGAKVELIPQVTGVPGRVTGEDIARAASRAEEIASEIGAFYVDQFHNPSSVKAHFESTGPEIYDQLGGQLDAFVSVVGSGGTFVGTSGYLKSRNAAVHCAVVEPTGCEALAGKPISKSQHVLQGTSYGNAPPHWEPQLADSFLSVTDEEAAEYRKLLATREGLYVGYSAAANVCGALKLLHSNRLHPKASVVTVLCDTGLKYGGNL